MNIILGATGQLGSYLSKQLDPGTLHTVSRNEFNSWIGEDRNSFKKKMELILQNSNTEKNRLFYCIGETNSSQQHSLLDETNFGYPMRIMESIQQLPLRMVTFGSIHELTEISNPYMDSKRTLFDFFLKSQNVFAWTHFQLHTLYSEMQPRRHMFLGQILESLSQNKPFEMTSGSQIRQFHHAEDIAKLIIRRLDDSESDSLEQINGHEVIKLKELAKFIFDSFNLSSLLRVGARLDNPSEVYEGNFYSVKKLDYLNLREIKEGVLQSLKEHVPS